MDIRKIKKLIELLEESDINEIEIKEGEEYVCSIYDHRPKVCRQYPFINKKKIEDCRPPRWEYWPKIDGLFQSK